MKDCKWTLDLGNVKATAEVHINGRKAGVLIGPNWEIDVSDYIRQGQKNRIEIPVTNTLVNYHSIAMLSPYAYDGDDDKSYFFSQPDRSKKQLVSGLIGPVYLHPLNVVKLTSE